MNSRPRGYDASDIKALMERTGTWARSWDDVLRYLQETEQRDGYFSRDEVPQLMADVRHLKDDNVHFTTDYRRVWQELTGERVETVAHDDDERSAASAPPPVIEPRRSRVLDVLRRVESREYRELARALDANRNPPWDRK